MTSSAAFGVAITIAADDSLIGAAYHTMERGEPAVGVPELPHAAPALEMPEEEEDLDVSETEDGEVEDQTAGRSRNRRRGRRQTQTPGAGAGVAVAATAKLQAYSLAHRSLQMTPSLTSQPSMAFQKRRGPSPKMARATLKTR